jgi:hypothetical protein
VLDVLDTLEVGGLEDDDWDELGSEKVKLEFEVLVVTDEDDWVDDWGELWDKIWELDEPAVPPVAKKKYAPAATASRRIAMTAIAIAAIPSRPPTNKII